MSAVIVFNSLSLFFGFHRHSADAARRIVRCKARMRKEEVGEYMFDLLILIDELSHCS